MIERARMALMASAPFRSRGMLVRSRWTRSQPTDIVLVWSDRVLLLPWLRQNIEIARSDVDLIEVVTHRVLPFVWSRNFYFRLTDGSVAPKLYTPLRPGRFRSGVIELGYPIKDLGREGFERRAGRSAAEAG
jgi:hypothetical protein